MAKSLVSLICASSKTAFAPIVQDGIVWTTCRKGKPGKLTFDLIYDDKNRIDEGMSVAFRYGGKKVFYGFVTETKSQADGIQSVTACDQIFYLKQSTESYVFTDKKQSQIVRNIAEDFGLQIGSIADTGAKIASLVEEEETLLDIIADAQDETLLLNGKLYVLYDDFGKLTLKNAADMKTDVVVTSANFEDYSFTSSIEGEVYNQIKLYFDNEKTGKREIYMAKNGAHINDWGLLQYTKALQSASGANNKAKQLLKLYDAKKRSLRITGQRGDLSVRGGSSVICKLDLPGLSLSNYMMVETAKHTFKDGAHTMDLDLIGGGINA